MINENNNYLDLIRKVAFFRKQYHTYVSNYIKDLDLSYSEFSFLKELVYTDGVSQEFVVKHTCVDKAAASRIVKSLEIKKLIIREKNKNDKRSVIIFLTPIGKEKVAGIDKILYKWFNDLKKSMGDENIDLLISSLELLNKSHPK